MLFYNSKTLCSPVIYISSFTWWINQFFLMQNRNAQSEFPVLWYPPRLVKCSHLSRLESDIPQSIYGIILSSYTQISTDVSLLILNLYLLFTNTQMQREWTKFSNCGNWQSATCDWTMRYPTNRAQIRWSTPNKQLIREQQRGQACLHWQTWCVICWPLCGDTMRGLILLISPFMDWGREISQDLGLCPYRIQPYNAPNNWPHSQTSTDVLLYCRIQQSILPCSPFHYFALNQLFEISPMDVPLSFFFY